MAKVRAWRTESGISYEVQCGHCTARWVGDYATALDRCLEHADRCPPSTVMKFNPGDDVLVTFDGHESRGEYIAPRSGFYECRIAIDPVADYGRKTPELGLYSIVYVRADDVRPIPSAAGEDTT